MLHGLHMPVQGHTPRAQAAATFLNGCIVWRPAEQPSDALHYQNAVHMVLLDTPGIGEPPYVYAERMAGRIRMWLNPEIWRNPDWPMTPSYPIFIMGNEPNQAAYDVPEGAEWDVSHWLEHSPFYAQELRQRWPGIVLAAAALRPEDAHLMAGADFAQFDMVTAHCYWQVADDIENPNLGQAWRHVADAAPGVPLFVTEVNSVALTPPGPMGEYERGTRPDEVGRWVHTLDERVIGYCVFIADGEGSSDVRWKQYDVSPDDARIIMLEAKAPLPPPEPPPPPHPSPAPAPTYTNDYRVYEPMGLDQYYGHLDTTSAGHTSPMRSEAAYHDLIAISQEAPPFNPRLPLAFTRAEGNNGVFGAAIAYGNYLGIKWAEQSWAYDTGVDADTGGTYAGFTTFGNLLREFKRIMHNSIIGPAYEAGDLTGVVEHYTNGPGTGHNKIDFYNQLCAEYPPGAVDPNAQGTIVTRQDFLGMVRSQLGHVRSGTFDTRNGDHYWCNPATGDFWCLSLMERAAEHLGIAVHPEATAYAAGRAMQSAGRLHTSGVPPVGSCIVLDLSFYAQGGHIGVCDQEDGQGMTCTCTPEGVGHRSWGMQTPGYMGWFDYEGIGERKAAEDMRIDGMNDPGTFERQWHGPNWQPATKTRKAHGKHAYNPTFGIESLWATEYLAGRPLGYALGDEESDPATPGRVVRYFSNGHITWDNNLQRGWVN